ncbi:putative late blight resistance protein homolog R1A-4 [Solanum tuberosum]|uniref:putative late blight resistance protein homolog R1A-4 n=1 Tax=Solanum tuberosum TaxID=4113 RepID=UPI00073A1809|nr:PREDICTED: putative late blight resistance protein homolog R1A-4 [Solanum tuberosum]
MDRRRFCKDFQNGKSLEEVAIDYLEDLISRNLIQARKRRFNGEIKACGIHDLLREFFDDYCKALPPVARSIYLFSHFDQPLEFLSRFNLLRVLAIFNENVSCQSFPLVITKLFHLRYLQFPFHNDIPDSISELQNLQTLICGRDAKFSGYPLDRSYSLPGKIWMMKNLRYIRMKGLLFLSSPRTESLLTGMPNLEEFSILCSTSCTNEVFSGIPNLKRLIIHLPYEINEIFNRQLDMSRLIKLEAFKFYGSTFFRHPIKRIGFPTSLRRLSLTLCSDFDWVDISSTSMMLPNLEELKLKRCLTFSRKWRLSDENKFKSLKLLLLSGANLIHWEASSNNFPNLKCLVLKGCHTLLEIPADFGDICTLKSIELHDCPPRVEDSARNIVQEQEDMGNNFLKVYIIHNNYSYTAVISLLQTLDQRNPQLFHGHTAEALDSLHATAEYFQNVLENASKSRFDTEKIKSLEEKIRVAASYAEDVLELKSSRIVKVSRWKFGISQHLDLLKAVKKWIQQRNK